MTEDRHKVIDSTIKVLGFLGVIATLAVGGCQYSSTMEKEFKKPFWEAQLKVCIEASDAASKLADASADKIGEEEIENLFTIYYGKAQLLLDSHVVKAIGDMGSRAVRCNSGTYDKNDCIRPLFNSDAMKVSQHCRNMLTESWDESLKKLDSEKLVADFTN
ncbi:hypothetical protein FORC53_1304 [Vibrio vulnificus]|uniref:Lipoprotein n=1 Tax=Vibrio vulnificus TaxID=672 RepID=A0AAN1PMW4_VIBVL|nr:hypothetical protein FORC53_1304 [Vibrio vulnificus]